MNYKIPKKIFFALIIFILETVYAFKQAFYYSGLLRESDISRAPYVGALFSLKLFGIVTAILFIISLFSIKNKNHNSNIIFIISIVSIIISLVMFSPYASSLSSLDCVVNLGC